VVAFALELLFWVAFRLWMLSLPLQSGDFHNYLKLEMRPLLYVPVESNGAMMEVGI